MLYLLAFGLGSVVTLVIMSAIDSKKRQFILDYFDLQSNKRK